MLLARVILDKPSITHIGAYDKRALATTSEHRPAEIGNVRSAMILVIQLSTTRSTHIRAALLHPQQQTRGLQSMRGRMPRLAKTASSNIALWLTSGRSQSGASTDQDTRRAHVEDRGLGAAAEDLAEGSPSASLDEVLANRVFRTMTSHSDLWKSLAGMARLVNLTTNV